MPQKPQSLNYTLCPFSLYPSNVYGSYETADAWPTDTAYLAATPGDYSLSSAIETQEVSFYNHTMKFVAMMFVAMMIITKYLKLPIPPMHPWEDKWLVLILEVPMYLNSQRLLNLYRDGLCVSWSTRPQ